MAGTTGIHHVTSVSGGAQRNLDFYVGTLGLRLVKRTVNFDDPGTWHLYYGDRTGSPGTLITFFPWQGIPAGRPGAGEVTTTAYSVASSELVTWARSRGVEGQISERFGQPVLSFRDTDGSRLELVGAPGTGSGGLDISGFHGVTLAVDDPQPTTRLLTDVFGYQAAGEEHGRLRLEVPGTAPGRYVEIVRTDRTQQARLGSGSVHHVAFRARDEEQQEEFRAELLSRGFEVTPVRDRQYFRSIYFREPGGILFEVATDPPGMLIDEPLESLGSSLRLPPWYEPARERIAGSLPPLAAPDSAANDR